MSDNRSKKATRRHHTATAINKQLEIAKSKGMTHMLNQPHRLAKTRALDCGNPACLVCHSEKIFHKPTLQERKFIESNSNEDQ